MALLVPLAAERYAAPPISGFRVGAGLMSPRANGLTLESSDPLVLEALAAAEASYAPYSRGFAGVALETASGAVHTGRYAENAAFNPSLSPLACALALRALVGGD